MVYMVDIVDIVDNIDIVDVTWRAGGEELCQQDTGEAADEDPVGVEPWKGHLGRESGDMISTQTLCSFICCSHRCVLSLSGFRAVILRKYVIIFYRQTKIIILLID